MSSLSTSAYKVMKSFLGAKSDVAWLNSFLVA